tara:strand:- start:853 stop:1671 length:819 start_codon:yes stop_codon:yes gene_type:complete
MKVLVQEDTGRLGDGIASSLVWIDGLEVSRWDYKNKPIMDMFDEREPDMIFISAKTLTDPALQIAVKRYPNTRVISLGLREEGMAALCFMYIDPHLSICRKTDLEIPTIIFNDGVMLGKIGKPAAEEDLMSDVLCFTNYIEGSQDQIATLQFLSASYNTKIFGSVSVPVPSYLGIISDQIKANAMASTKVYVDLDGGSHNDLLWLKKNTVTKFKNILDLKKKIDKALKEGDQDINHISVKNKTYFDLCSEVLNFFGLKEAGDNIMEKKGQLL